MDIAPYSKTADSSILYENDTLLSIFIFKATKFSAYTCFTYQLVHKCILSMYVSLFQIASATAPHIIQTYFYALGFSQFIAYKQLKWLWIMIKNKICKAKGQSDSRS